jgi:hypothetical protein
MHETTYADLDRLSGELLPERSVLSTVVSVPGGATAMLSSCQAITYPGSPGLLAALGLGVQQPYTTMVCTPAAIAH